MDACESPLISSTEMRSTKGLSLRVFPSRPRRVLPSYAIGILSLIVLAVAIFGSLRPWPHRRMAWDGTIRPHRSFLTRSCGPRAFTPKYPRLFRGSFSNIKLGICETQEPQILCTEVKAGISTGPNPNESREKPEGMGAFVLLSLISLALLVVAAARAPSR